MNQRINEERAKEIIKKGNERWTRLMSDTCKRMAELFVEDGYSEKDAKVEANKSLNRILRDFQEQSKTSDAVTIVCYNEAEALCTRVIKIDTGLKAIIKNPGEPLEAEELMSGAPEEDNLDTQLMGAMHEMNGSVEDEIARIKSAYAGRNPEIDALIEKEISNVVGSTNVGKDYCRVMTRFYEIADIILKQQTDGKPIYVEELYKEDSKITDIICHALGCKRSILNCPIGNI